MFLTYDERINMDRLWNQLLNYLFSDCFWCGKRIYMYYATIVVGNMEHLMHDGPMQDCADQYYEWHNRPIYTGEVVGHHYQTNLLN